MQNNSKNLCRYSALKEVEHSFLPLKGRVATSEVMDVTGPEHRTEGQCAGGTWLGTGVLRASHLVYSNQRTQDAVARHWSSGHTFGKI